MIAMRNEIKKFREEATHREETLSRLLDMAKRLERLQNDILNNKGK
jgi:hypothetical protein